MSNLRHSMAAACLVLAARAARAQDTHIHGFTDVTFSASDRAGAPSAFALGQYVLHISSALADHWSFLGETVFEFDEGFIVDVERVIISYRPNPHFQVAAGKHHTPIGYWNNAYHHGTLFQPTITRPLMFLFEDEGGVLPIHSTGVLLAGRDLTAAHLGFDAMVANGIGGTPTSDNNAAKSLTLSAHSQVTSALRVGASFYQDRIAAGTLNLAGTPLSTRVTQRMAGASVIYLSAAVEAMGEYLRVTNKAASGTTTGTDAFYVYGGYRVGKLVPYVRYDLLDFDPADPYFVPDDTRLGIVGARYDFASTAALKVEYWRHKSDALGTANELHIQLAVGY
jgi:hypothetical protein